MTILTAPPTDTLSSVTMLQSTWNYSCIVLGTGKKNYYGVLPGSIQLERIMTDLVNFAFQVRCLYINISKTLVDCATGILTGEASCFIAKTSQQSDTQPDNSQKVKHCTLLGLLIIVNNILFDNSHTVSTISLVKTLCLIMNTAGVPAKPNLRQT